MMIRQIAKDRRGTALLVALLVMGILVAVSLALSTLIFRENRITKDLIDSGKAFYAAESGVEVALYGLNNNLPGWQPDADGQDGYKSYKVGDDLVSVGELRVKNRCQAYPCFDQEEFDLGSNGQNVADPRIFYDVLDLNESINIPLFVVDNGVEVPVGHFVVEFYSPFDPQQDLKVNVNDANSFLSGWDVLRWKILGVNKDSDVAETIGDFTSLSVLNKAETDQSFLTNATRPSWFGTEKCNANHLQDEEGERYNEDIICSDYYVNRGGSFGSFKVDVDTQVADIIAGVCSQTQAREFYQYLGNGDQRKLSQENIQSCYPIKNFLRDHKLNYLTLTNLINPSVFKDSVELNGRTKEALSKLYFRVELFTDDPNTGNQTVREYADISANGYSGNTKQSIDVKIKRGSFMPVFNFAIYSTYKGEKGYDYYYGQNK